MNRTLLASLALALGTCLGAVAQGKATVYCASTLCWQFKTAAEGKDAQTRANNAMDTINKYLGGKGGKVATRPAGKNVRILLNNELVAVVTPADAKADKEKSPRALADRWSKKLQKAYNETAAGK